MTMSPSQKGTKKSAGGFTDEERAAVREAIRERRARPGKENGEPEVLAKIAELPSPDRDLAERLHAIVRSHAPSLSPKTWYGMPAYARADGDIICFFQPASKFKARYAELGFGGEARLDEGHMWATRYALTELAGTEEARIIALLKKAVGEAQTG